MKGQKWHEVPGLFHAFNVRDSMKQALEAPWEGPLGQQALDLTAGWMQQVLAEQDG